MRIAVIFFPALMLLAQDGNVVKREQLDAESKPLRVAKITYMSDGLKINGYLLSPTGGGKYPCIIYNRGGNPALNSLNDRSILEGRMAHLAAAGYVVVASHYRQGGGSEGKDEMGGADLNDVLNLIRVLDKEPQCDSTRIGMAGWSRGGMMTYIALTRTNRIKAAAVGAAPADLLGELKFRPEMEIVYKALIPGYASNKEAALAQRSAVHWADRIAKDTPLLLLQGTADWRHDALDTMAMAEALFRVQHPFRLVLFEGGDHAITEHTAEVNRILTNWFDDYLRDGKKWPSLKPHGQ